MLLPDQTEDKTNHNNVMNCPEGLESIQGNTRTYALRRLRKDRKGPLMLLTDRDRACYGPRNTKPLGSVEWCWQTIDLLKIRWQRKDFTEQQFEETLAELRQQEVWKVVPPEQPYGSLDALLGAEIGYTRQEAHQQILAQASTHPGRPKLDESSNLTRQQRAEKNGIGTNGQYKLDYLKREAPDLFAAVEKRTLSIHRAYMLARGIPPETPLTTLHRYWRKVPPEDRLRFLLEMLTPNERRLIATGLWPEEDSAC
jgi:hypothetical protein